MQWFDRHAEFYYYFDCKKVLQLPKLLWGPYRHSKENIKSKLKQIIT
jgi:hypothetical protein